MKNSLFRIILVLLSILIVACSTTKYNPDEFKTENYQKNMDNAVDAPDMLNDLDKFKASATPTDATDLAKLVQADILYNQGEYLEAYPFYKFLAFKYQDPKIIYKAIMCLDHFEVNATQYRELDQLTDLFIKVEPNSNLAKLFAIKVAIRDGNLDVAKQNLDYLVSKNTDNIRAIFLFLSAVLGDVNVKYSSIDLKNFAGYVFSQYKEKCPEASLMVALAYANIQDIEDLNMTLDYIQDKFPEWQMPLYWSLNVLLQLNALPDVIKLAYPRLVENQKIDLRLQNIYIAALIKSNELDLANSYLKQQLNNKNNDKNQIVTSLGIVAAKNGEYTQSVNYLNQVITENQLQNDVINMSIATMFDYMGKPQRAIPYYQKITDQTLLPLKKSLLLADYAYLKDYSQADAILEQEIINFKINTVDAIIFKAAYYAGVSDYTRAYQILFPYQKTYRKNRSFLYQYAATSFMLGKNDEAIRLYKEYIKANPADAYGYNDLAYIYADKTKNTKLAMKYAREAYLIAPTDPMILDTLGWVYYKQGNFHMALQYVKKAYDLSMEAEVGQHLQKIYQALGQDGLAKNVKIVGIVELNQTLRKIILDKMLKILMFVEYGSR